MSPLSVIVCSMQFSLHQLFFFCLFFLINLFCLAEHCNDISSTRCVVKKQQIQNANMPFNICRAKLWLFPTLAAALNCSLQERCYKMYSSCSRNVRSLRLADSRC